MGETGPTGQGVLGATGSTGHGGKVLVAAAREADQDQLFLELDCLRERVRWLERRDDPFGLGQTAEGAERLFVTCADVLGPIRVAEECVLGADA